ELRRLREVELVARALPAFSQGMPPIATNLVLPDWEGSDRNLWPPRELPAAVVLATSMGSQVDPRAYSGDWWQVDKQRSDANHKEHERIDAYYANETAKQERRQNNEERAAFLQRHQRGA